MALITPDYFQPKAADAATAAANTAVVITYAAATNQRHQIWQIDCGYSAAPTAGSLKIEDVSGTVIWQVPITAAGPLKFTFPAPITAAAENTALIITLAAGAGSVVGFLNVLHTEVQ